MHIHRISEIKSEMHTYNNNGSHHAAHASPSTCYVIQIKTS